MPRTKAVSNSKVIKPKKTTTSVTSHSSKTIKNKKITSKKVVAPFKIKKIKKVMVDIIEDDDISPADLEIDAKSEKEKEDDLYNSLVTEKYEDETVGNVVNREEIDSQKKFFSQFIREDNIDKNDSDVSNSEGTKNDYSDEAQPAKNIGLYRKLVWKFLAATVLLLGVVFYFSFSKLTIEITPKGEALNDTLFLKVSASSIVQETNTLIDNSDPRTPVVGDISEIDSSLEAVYPASGEEFGNEELIGSVKIINNNNKNQALVAKTRILSPDNKLYRIKNAVVVPAGGEISVDIYADKPSQELAIGPSSFIIPGLWVGLQDKIFARSETEFTYEKKVNRFIKQTDIESAAKDINERLVANASNNVSSKGSGWLYSVSDKTKISYSSKAGDLADQFSAKVEGSIIGVSFSKESALKLVSAKIKLLVPDEKEIIEFKPENIIYTLESYDESTKTATIKASFSGTMALKSDSTIINREQLVNLTKEQIDNYLKAFPEIKSYELKFFPSFIKRAPSLVDRINIIINKNK